MKLKKSTNFSKDEKIVKELFKLTEPSYVDNTAVLEREINRCNEIYLLYNNEQELIAFFMVNFEIIERINTYYLGLSGCHNNYKGNGYAKYLYNSFFMDCKHKENEINSKILCWWTTATPVAFYWFNRNIDNCEPNMHGDISENGYKIFLMITEVKFSQIQIDKAKPFILKNVAIRTNYSPIERQRLSKIKEQLGIRAFDRFPIDETEGDRYLMFGYAPKIEVIENRLNQEALKYASNR